MKKYQQVPSLQTTLQLTQEGKQAMYLSSSVYGTKKIFFFHSSLIWLRNETTYMQTRTNTSQQTNNKMVSGLDMRYLCVESLN